jgi:thioredoxin
MKRLPSLVFIVLAGSLIFVSCNVNNDTNPEVKQVESGVVISSTKAEAVLVPLPTMLELGSDGCKPCEQMKPVMAGLETDYGDKIRVTFHDVRKNQKIAEQYSIRLIPTQIFLDAEGNEFFRHEGFFAREEIEKVFRDMGVNL